MTTTERLTKKIQSLEQQITQINGHLEQVMAQAETLRVQGNAAMGALLFARAELADVTAEQTEILAKTVPNTVE